MSELDLLLPQLGTTDTRKKLELGNTIINHLKAASTIQCEDIGQVIDGLIPWIQSSNFKVILNGLDAMCLMVQRMAEDFRPYISNVIPPTLDRLGDSKDAVREKAQLLLSAVMVNVVAPNLLFERLISGFSHKNGKVREETMYCLRNTLATHGSTSITISRLLPHIIRLLSDPTAPVRDCAFNTLVEAYRHYGERLRMDLNKKYSVPPAKMPSLMTRFDDIRDTDLLLPTATMGHGHAEGKDDETDRASVKSGGSKSRASSAPPVRRSVLGAAAPSKGGSGTAAGAVDESSFFSSFEDVPKVTIYHAKDLDEHMSKIRECINTPTNDWDKRVEALRKIRGVIIAGGASYEEFFPHLRLLEPAMQLSIKDLRSQVVREACITVAYMSQELHHKVDHFCETVLPTLINLIPNTAKVMASAGVVCIRFMVANTHHHKLIPLITRECSSRNKEIRRMLFEFLDQLVHTWPTHAMEKHSQTLGESIKKGISDADPEARAYARKVFWGFADHFREESEVILHSLEPSYKKMLQGEPTAHGNLLGGIPSSMTSSAHGSSSISSKPRISHRPTWSRASSAAGSTENLSSLPSLPLYNKKSGIPTGIPTPKTRPPLYGGSDSPASTSSPSNFRSNSAIDLQAARRAQARSQYASQNRMRGLSGASLPRPRKSAEPVQPSADRTARARSRGGVSQSQPTSRSGSPSSRLSYATYNSPGDSAGGTLGRRRRSGIPRSTGASRETSPSRHGIAGSSPYSPSKGRSRSISGSVDIPPQPPGRPRVLAHKILQQSREAENALADALVTLPPNALSPIRKNYNKSFEDHSDNESETSSVCSEISFDSYRRNEMMWYGPQQRVIKENWENQGKGMDVSDIISYCASTHWSDRKEGLVGLHGFLRGAQMLTGSELKRITELFTKMFTDTHTKVFSLFLDTLMELIIVHHVDLHDWLYILLTRLLNKLGSDLLGSVQTKIHRTLDLIKDSFPCSLQFAVLCRFITDATQTPNPKVKAALLTHLKCLVDVMDAGELSQNHSGGDNHDAGPALGKIIHWTQDLKSVEVRRAASAAILALFNCNKTWLTNVLKDLPTHTKAQAAQIIQGHMKRAASLDASPSPSPSGPASLGSTPTILQSPNTSLPRPHTHSNMHAYRQHSRGTFDVDDTENLNPEEVFKSLKRTTDEIRNYSFEYDNSDKPDGLLDKYRDSTSQDSGISQLSSGGNDLHRGLLDPCASLTEEGNGLLSGRSSSGSSPTHRNLFQDNSRNGVDQMIDQEFGGKGDSSHESDSELMCLVIQELSHANTAENPRIQERSSALSSLSQLARSGSALVWNENFRVVLRLLLVILTENDGSLRSQVLQVLTEMMRRSPLVAHFLQFSELIILRVLKTNAADKAKEVVWAAQVCAGTMAEILPPDIVIRVLKPLVHMGEFPINQSAIKMMHKLIEAHPAEIIMAALPDIMPGLIKAYYNHESSVRKASVFCIVSLHTCVGEAALRPFLSSLTGSKLKLLNFYIKRAEQNGSGASSPKSEPQM